MNFREKMSDRYQRQVEVNLTPLVDVVLQLVLFFMVTAQFAVLPGLKLTLPTIGQPTSMVKADDRLEIAISPGHGLFFEGQPATIDNLAGLLEQTGANSQDVVVLISADENATHGDVVAVMDILNREGFRRLVFAAQPDKKSPQDQPPTTPKDGQE